MRKSSRVLILFLLISSAFLLASRSDAQVLQQERLCDSSIEDCRQILIDLIKAETVGIDVGFWFMEDSRYATELVKKWQAGVPVRVLIDTKANTSYPENVPNLNTLQSGGIPMRRITSSYLHWKTMIFAGQNVVEFGSANYSPHAFVYQQPLTDFIDETIYFTNDASLVNSFKTKFDDAWVNAGSFTNYANVSGPLTRSYPVYPIDSNLNFPPFQDFGPRSVARYDAETVGIDAMNYRITDNRHTYGLIRAFQRGVPVRVIVEQREYRIEKRWQHSLNVDRLIAAGIPVRQRKHLGWCHEKLAILKNQGLAIFGSQNWSFTSGQYEHNYFTKKAWMYQWFVDQFERKWNSNTETEPFIPLPPDAPIYASPSSGASVQSDTVTLKWNAGFWAHKYDIYFGTTPNPPLLAADVLLGNSTTPTSYITYTISGLSQDTTYYWKVVSKTIANLSAPGTVWNFRTGAPPAPGTGDVVLWASKAPTVRGTWAVTADSTAAGGSRIGTANAGLKVSSPLASPNDYFEATFTASAGVAYRLWVRGKAVSNSWANDSAFVQFSDSVTSGGTPTWQIGTTSATTVTIEDCTNCGLSAWGWNDNLSNGTAGALGTPVYFATSGTHTIRVQTREDGLSIDQILLSTQAFMNQAPGATKNDGTILAEIGVSGGPPPPPPPPPPPLPSGWSSSDIGAVGPAGSSTYSNGTFTVKGAGADVWGTADALQYAYKTLNGDGTITARVATLNGSQAWTKVGVMIRGSTSAGSAQAFMFVSLSKGVVFQYRKSDGATSLGIPPSAGTAPRWVRLTRAGSTITALVSPDGVNWTTVGSDTFTMPANALVGLAVSSHTTTATATGTFDSVTTQ